MKYICIWLIRFYRKFLSPLKRNPTCRFTPTCSAYAIEAYQKRGFFVGSALTVWRILRCNPYSAGGYDPVPEKHKKIPKYQKDKEEVQSKQYDNNNDDSDKTGEEKI